MTINVLTLLNFELGLGATDAMRLIRSAPKRYKRFSIPKRTGGKREIAQPASELKVVQSVIVEKILSGLPVHPSATAYVEGSSIRINALRHAANGPIKKFDFKDFFPSLTEHAWIRYCSRHQICDRGQAIMLGRLLFMQPPGGRTLRLSVGAPSSPMLSNILMYEFDRLITERVAKHSVTYTRYADDLTFSAPRTGYLNSIEGILRKTLAELTSPKLRLNENKTVTATKKFRREVTGIILTNDKRLSIGKERKRKIRAAVHHFSLGKLNIDQSVKLAGLLAFAKDIEPEFYATMERVYGLEVIAQIKGTLRGYRRPEFRIKGK